MSGSVWVRVCVVAVLACASVGCDPCGDLDARICNDLGSDCSVWRNELADLRASTIGLNEPRFKARWNSCRALADDDIYASRILPSIQNAVTRLRDPSAPLLPVDTSPVEGGSGGYLFGLFPLFALGAWFVYTKIAMPKRIQAAQGRADDIARAQAEAMEELRKKQGGGGPSA